MTTLVLIGPHGAGKTTLGAALADTLGWPFHDEIGRRLMESGSAPEVGVDARTRPEDFDARVFALERERDLAHLGRPRIVETWHPGNLAYAARRNAALARRLDAEIRDHIRCLGPVLVLPLTAPDETLLQRFSEPGDPVALLPFFREVAAVAEACARRWGLCCRPPLSTGPDRSPASLVQDLVALLSSHAARVVCSSGTCHSG